MFSIISWLIYGVIVGVLAKALHPGEDPIGFLPTIGIGVAGSYVGGLLSWVLELGSTAFAPSGILMGVVGGVIFCWCYKKFHLDRYLAAQKAEIEAQRVKIQNLEENK